jgi:hypothetical protein
MGLAEQLPGLRPAVVRSHNLPVQLTSFIGRPRWNGYAGCWPETGW